MNWTAPAVHRHDPPRSADELTNYEGWIDFHRETLLYKCAGLTREQLVARPVSSSLLSLLGLVRHMTEVEFVWFRNRVAGLDVMRPYSSNEDPTGEFEPLDPATAEADLATYHAEIENTRRLTAGRSLDETFSYGPDGIVCNLRYVYANVLEEYARHNGHADFIREMIDGETGR